MIRHVVALTFTPTVTDTQRDELRAGLDELAATLPTIRSFRHGPDLGLADGNADWAIVADFDDESGWRAYADHPDHQRFIAEVLRPLLASRSALQFEF